MLNQAGFILKVFIVSILISVLIKYVGPLLPLPPTPLVALTLVLLPATCAALTLWRRTFQQQN